MEKPRLQFSLGALLLTIAAVAVVLALMFLHAPALIATLAFVALVPLASVFAVIGLVYGSTTMRSFCIGGLLPLGMLLFWVTIQLEQFASLFENGRAAETVFAKVLGSFLLSSIVRIRRDRFSMADRAAPSARARTVSRLHQAKSRVRPGRGIETPWRVFVQSPCGRGVSNLLTAIRSRSEELTYALVRSPALW